MITQKHWNTLSKSKIPSPRILFQFAWDIIHTGKLAEICSFFIWECYHKLRLFRKSSYLTINEMTPSLRIEDFFQKRDIILNQGPDSSLHLKISQINWHVIHYDGEGNIWGSAIEDQYTLVFQRKGALETTKIFTFPETIRGIFISRNNDIFTCCGGKIYRSSSADGHTGFTSVLTFIADSSVFRHNNTFTETPDGTLLIGEYAIIWKSNKWVFGAILYFSNDSGKTWKKSEFLRKAHVNKHIHLVRYSPLFKRLILAEGDNKKRLWAKKDDQYTQESIDNLDNWENFTPYHLRMGGYTSLAEINGRMIFGTDYMGGTNFIVKTVDLKKFTRKVIPDPYRRAWIRNMAVTSDNKIWASLRFGSSSKTPSMIMFSGDLGETWNKVLDYDGTKYFVDIISSSAKKQDNVYIELRGTEEENSTLQATISISASN